MPVAGPAAGMELFLYKRNAHNHDLTTRAGAAAIRAAKDG